MSTAPETVRSRLAVGLRLDSLWAETMGIDPSDTKERPLRLVADLLNQAGVSCAQSAIRGTNSGRQDRGLR